MTLSYILSTLALCLAIYAMWELQQCVKAQRNLYKTLERFMGHQAHIVRAGGTETKHPSHETRASDASSFDEICIHCGARDIAGGGWGDLAKPCPASLAERAKP